MSWRFREALERGEIALPDDDSLLAELSALRYDYDTYGRIRLEQKDEMRQRIGRSPDRADAALLGFDAANRRTGGLAYMGGLIVNLDTGVTHDPVDFGEF